MKNVYVQAFGGLTSGRLLCKLRNRVFSVSEYKNIVIHIGTNDIFDISCSQFEYNIKHIIDEIRISNVSACILISAILPRPRDFRDSKPIVFEFNEKLKYFSEVTFNVKYMAILKSFLNRFGFPIKALFQADKLHLNITGLNKFEKFLANTLAHL